MAAHKPAKANKVVPFVLDGETLRAVNEAQGYRYRQRQKYLQEDDRVEIIRRILGGETQSKLAREFGVTRAAICNTFKNREDILARSKHVYEKQCAQAERLANVACDRTDTDDTDQPIKLEPMAAEPRASTPVEPIMIPSKNDLVNGTSIIASGMKRKRGTHRGSTTPLRDEQRHQGSSTSSIEDQSMRELTETHCFFSEESWPATGIHLCRAHAAMHLANRVCGATTQSFRFLANRLIRLLLEEALAITTLTTTHRVHRPDEANPVVIGLGDGGYPLIREYQQIFPDRPFGLVQFKRDRSVDVSMPARARRASSVILMTCEAASGVTLCHAIRSLVRYGIREECIFVAVVFTSSLCISRIEDAFPAVCGIVGAIDAHYVDSSDSEPETFLDRYYHPDSIHHSR